MDPRSEGQQLRHGVSPPHITPPVSLQIWLYSLACHSAAAVVEDGARLETVRERPRAQGRRFVGGGGGGGGPVTQPLPATRSRPRGNRQPRLVPR